MGTGGAVLYDVTDGGRVLLKRVGIEDGAEKTLLVDDGLGLLSNHPWRVSPDGCQVVIQTGEAAQGQNRLWVARADGSAMREVIEARRAASASSTPVTWSPDGRHLALLVPTAETSSQLVIIGAADGVVESTVATGLMAGSVECVWAPDSSRVVFTKVGASGRAAFVVEVGSSEATEVSVMHEGLAEAVQFVWSGPANGVAYKGVRTGEVSTSPDLYVSLWDSTTASWTGRVVSPPGGTGRAELEAWSPDGSRLAYRSGTASHMDARVLEIATGSGVLFALPDPSRTVTDITWARDGKGLFIGAAEPPYYGEDSLFFAPVEDGTVTAIAPSLAAGARVRGRKWSPDGSRLLYAAAVDYASSYALYTVAPDGAGARRLSVATSEDPATLMSTAQWSADGSALVFVERTNAARGVWLADLASGRETKMSAAADAGSPYGPRWTWRGDRIVYDRIVYMSSGASNSITVYVSGRDGASRALTPTPIATMGQWVVTR